MIDYSDSLDGICKEQLGGFFVGWRHPLTPTEHIRLLAGSSHFLLAMDQESGKVVGFITALSDGLLSAYIPLLEVLPPYQKQGICRELVRRMLVKLEGLGMVDLLCDPPLLPFYQCLGFQPATAASIRRPRPIDKQ
ncbi:MAG: GNAT family N-acetyltransferase [Coprothermobacterota bacterium]|nr:GNAT family N-acetyltransferase [Coprothermobacterota bacterium]